LVSVTHPFNALSAPLPLVPTEPPVYPHCLFSRPSSPLDCPFFPCLFLPCLFRISLFQETKTCSVRTFLLLVFFPSPPRFFFLCSIPPASRQMFWQRVFLLEFQFSFAFGHQVTLTSPFARPAAPIAVILGLQFTSPPFFLTPLLTHRP